MTGPARQPQGFSITSRRLSSWEGRKGRLVQNAFQGRKMSSGRAPGTRLYPAPAASRQVVGQEKVKHIYTGLFSISRKKRYIARLVATPRVNHLGRAEVDFIKSSANVSRGWRNAAFP